MKEEMKEGTSVLTTAAKVQDVEFAKYAERGKKALDDLTKGDGCMDGGIC
jgi:hypothetical protein